MKNRIITIVMFLIVCVALIPAALAAYEAEPNNDYKTASAIDVDTTVYASFTSGDREDWFRVTLPTAGALQIFYESPPQCSLNIKIHRVNSSGGLESIYNGAFYLISNAVAEVVSRESDKLYLPAGEYYIQNYSVTSIAADYTMIVSFTPNIAVNTELEPNSDYKTATVITQNAPFFASFASQHIGKDDDWYKITLTKPDKLQFNIEIPTKYDVNLTIYNVNTSGALSAIYRNNYYHIDSTLDYVLKTTESVGVSAGDYYIQLHSSKWSKYEGVASIYSDYKITAVTSIDAPSSWAREEVASAINTGLVPENLQQNYTQPVSRSNVAQMFINLIEKYSGQSIDAFLAKKGVSINSGAFTDTNDKAVLAANALGIIKGVGNGKFEPDGTFTRAHVAAIFNRIANVLDISTAGYTHSFSDVSGHWVDIELGWPVYIGIIKGVGDNKFEPDTHLTTEQVIAATYRAMQLLLDK